MSTTAPVGAHQATAVVTPVVRAKWIYSLPVDVALAFLWVPFALAAHLLESNPHALQRLVGLVFLISFAHQPLTLALVYGDEAQRSARPRLYRWTPFAAAALIFVGLRVSLVAVAVIAGLWNAEHTLMQRYGLTRLYGRKAGDDNGRLEKAMIVSWLAIALLAAGGFLNLPRLADQIGMGATNRRAINALHAIQPVARLLIVPVLLAAIVAASRWVRAERALGLAANPAKHVYLAATLGLVLTIVVDPIAGFAGYVASHALEYFVIVHHSVSRRASSGDPSMLARSAATRPRRAALYGGYVAAIVALTAVTWNLWGGKTYSFAVLFFGALHIFYDGFVWKLRKPRLAASLGLPVTA
jgi:uncharacterized membrane protein YidH (DUF202 family)